MIGIVIAAHGHLAQELLTTAEQIVGTLTAIATCSVEPNISPDELKEQIRAAVKSVEEGQGVIVFADLIGGSPCNQSLSLCQQARLEVITGANLPMLLKANTLRATNSGLSETAKLVASFGQRSICCATEQLREQPAL